MSSQPTKGLVTRIACKRCGWLKPMSDDDFDDARPGFWVPWREYLRSPWDAYRGML